MQFDPGLEYKPMRGRGGCAGGGAGGAGGQGSGTGGGGSNKDDNS